MGIDVKLRELGSRRRPSFARDIELQTKKTITRKGERNQNYEFQQPCGLGIQRSQMIDGGTIREPMGRRILPRERSAVTAIG